MRRSARPVAVVLGAALLLGGCSRSVELSPGAAESLQEAVLRVHQAAAEQRLDAAQDAAAQVRAALDAAAEADEISAVRYREIDAALTAAEEELAAAAQAASEDEDRAGQDDDG